MGLDGSELQNSFFNSKIEEFGLKLLESLEQEGASPSWTSIEVGIYKRLLYREMVGLPAKPSPDNLFGSLSSSRRDSLRRSKTIIDAMTEYESSSVLKLTGITLPTYLSLTRGEMEMITIYSNLIKKKEGEEADALKELLEREGILNGAN